MTSADISPPRGGGGIFQYIDPCKLVNLKLLSNRKKKLLRWGAGVIGKPEKTTIKLLINNQIRKP